MPAKKSRQPAYCHHKPTGQAYVRLNGRMIYLGGYDSPQSRAEYDRAIAEWLAHGRQLSESNDLTVSEIAAAYWTHAEGYYTKNGSATSEQDNIRCALRPLRALYGGTLADDFGPGALRTVRQALVDKGNARTYINAQVNRIRRMFKWGVEHELVDPKILQGLQAVVGLRRGRLSVRESAPVTPVPRENVQAVEVFVSRQVWAMIRLQQLTGMRPGEVFIMAGRDIDMTRDVWLYRPMRHKTEHHGHERVVELGPRAQEVIRPFLRPNMTRCLFSPVDAMAESRARAHAERRTPLSCGNHPGTNRKRNPKRKPRDCYDKNSYRQAIIRACDRVGVPRWHPHQLRHTFATEIRKQYGIEASRAMLGQRSLDATQIYAEIDRERSRDIAAKLG